MTRRSLIHSLHERRGARFVDFGGWEMPIQYQSVLSEHAAVRNDCGWFDVSHLGRFDMIGADAPSLIEATFSNSVADLESGRSQYTMALNDEGGVIDDIMIWRWSRDHFTVIPNAANHERIMGMFGSGPIDLRPSTFSVAVQGPRAPSILEQVIGVRPRRSHVATTTFAGATVMIGGTGYTGEPGGEVVGPPEIASELIEALEAGGAIACGLGARDTLRLEAGLALWGQDLDEQTTPLEAGLDFAVSLAHDFPGKAALISQETDGLRKRLVAFRTEGRLIPRHGCAVRTGEASGVVTSGNFSPTLQYGIGLAYLSPPLHPTTLEVEIRGDWVNARTVELPFYRRRSVAEGV